MKAEQATAPHADHGEGPVWDEQADALRWVDMLAGDLLTLRGDDSVSRQHVGAVLACVRPRQVGGLVLALERGFALLDADQHRPQQLPELWTDPSVRMNDGACDPQGRFYCGSMDYRGTPGRGRLHRLDPDGTADVVLDDVTVSNGLAWSPDGATAYYIDSACQSVDAFTFDSGAGTLGSRRSVVQVDRESGTPDGMTVDAEGGLWVALWGAGAVHRYTPDGHLDAVLQVPVRTVTACAFGGPALGQLYITTSRHGPASDVAPAAGALFRAVPGVTGLPSIPFKG